MEYREREKEKVGDRPAKLNEKQRQRARGKENIHSWGSTVVEREVYRKPQRPHIKSCYREKDPYIFPRFSGERSPGASAKLTREEQQRRATGKCFPRACLVSIALRSRFALAFARP